MLALRSAPHVPWLIAIMFFDLQTCRGVTGATTVATPRSAGIHRLKTLSARGLLGKASATGKQSSNVVLDSCPRPATEPATDSVAGFESPQQQHVVGQVGARELVVSRPAMQQSVESKSPSAAAHRPPRKKSGSTSGIGGMTNQHQIPVVCRAWLPTAKKIKLHITGTEAPSKQYQHP